jgi:hypothetical protein
MEVRRSSDSPQILKSVSSPSEGGTLRAASALFSLASTTENQQSVSTPDFNDLGHFHQKLGV